MLFENTSQRYELFLIIKYPTNKNVGLVLIWLYCVYGV